MSEGKSDHVNEKQQIEDEAIVSQKTRNGKGSDSSSIREKTKKLEKSDKADKPKEPSVSFLQLFR